MAMAAKTMYRMGLGGALTVMISLGLTVDVQAQASSGDSLRETSKNWQRQLNSIWSRIAQDDEDKEPPLGSRGPLCLIAPTVLSRDVPVIWHDTPVIVWQVRGATGNTVPRFVVRNSQTQEIMWDYASSMAETSVVYDGKPLEAGQTYELEVYQNAAAQERLIFPNFQVLPQSVRTLIANGLANAAKQNQLSVAEAEWIAVQRAEYFTNRSLPYDAIQSLFSVSDPSAELLETQNRIIDTMCDNP